MEEMVERYISEEVVSATNMIIRMVLISKEYVRFEELQHFKIFPMKIAKANSST